MNVNKIWASKMKTTYEEFKNACPEVDEELIREYLSRLGEQYFKRFSKRDMFRHLRGISLLSHERPVEVLVEQKRVGLVDCTVFAFDYPYVFSLITGILAGMGLSVLTGDVFTSDVIETWISYKMEKEVQAMDLRPHPWEFALYYDI